MNRFSALISCVVISAALFLAGCNEQAMNDAAKNEKRQLTIKIAQLTEKLDGANAKIIEQTANIAELNEQIKEMSNSTDMLANILMETSAELQNAKDELAGLKSAVTKQKPNVDMAKELEKIKEMQKNAAEKMENEQ